MSRALTFYSTSIGKKVVMAITGLILFGFVIGHMLGNLQVFMGANQMNAYAAMLKANATLLWGVRIVLLVAVILHIVAAVQLTRMSQRSRPEGYHYKDVIQADYAARTMRWSGPIIGRYRCKQRGHRLLDHRPERRPWIPSADRTCLWDERREYPV